MKSKLAKSLQLILLLMFLVTSVVQTFAQGTLVRGKVFSYSDNQTIIGANVIIEGTAIGTTSDVDGNFSLKLERGQTLLVSYIGFKTKRIAYAGESNLNVYLEVDAQTLDELVVVGYGTMKKSDLSGASVTIGEEKLKGSIITNMDQALQGRVAGVTSVQTSGQPGSSVSIRIRGQSTINAGAEPLYVIDGIPVQVQGKSGADYGLGDALGNGAISTISPLSTINPSDIISMEILKDASATAIYGSRASNGVVLVTTKRGKKGEAKFTYEGMSGIQRQTKRLDIMNLQQFAEYSNSMASETAGRDARAEFLDPSLLGVGTNWQDAVFQTAPMQSHTVSAQGGSDVAQYYVSGSFLNQDGTVIGTKFNRYSFRTNMDAQLKKWLKMGVNMMYSSTNERLGLADSDEGIINIALLSTPDIPIYDIDGNYTSVSREGVASRVNPIAKALDEDNLLTRSSLTGNIYFDVTFMKDLVLHTEFATDLGGSQAERFRPTAKYGSWSRDINSCSKQSNHNVFWQVKNYLTYNKSFGNHKANLMLGQEMSESSWNYISVTATNLPNNDIHNPSLGSDPTINSGFGSSSLASAFARANYNYNDKYFATYTFRYDGSSNFGPKNRWAPFQAIAASWRITQEEFMKPLSGTVSNMKLRLGWGETGNQNIGGYRWGAAISPMETGLGLGYRQSGIANPYVKWETQQQLNVGLDLGLFNNRVELIVDAYNKVSKDMLMPMQLPSYIGTRGNSSSALAAPWGNYGTINNKGLEFALTTHNFTDEFKWDTDFQLSFNKNKLVALDGIENSAIEGYGQWSDVVSRTEIGESLYNFYGYQVEGIYQDKDDLLNSPKAEKYPTDGKSFSRTNTVFPGDIKFKDISGPDGTPDGKIDVYDRTNIGSPMPLFTFGLTNTFHYKNFDLSIFISGTYGNKVMNYMSRNLTNMKSIWNNQLAVVTDRARLEAIDATLTYPAINTTGNTINNWYEDIDNVKVANSGTNVPRAIWNDPNDNARLSDRYIEDGSYLRIKNLSLGYNFSNRVLSTLRLETLRAYVNIQNLYTLTNYTGFDPEIGASTASSAGNVYGLDNGRYPSPQVYSFGINISF